MVIFHSYVKLPEGIHLPLKISQDIDSDGSYPYEDFTKSFAKLYI